MKAFTSLLAILAAPALVMTTQAAEVPQALADFQLPTNGEQGVCFLITPALTKDFETLHTKALQKLQTLDQEKIKGFIESYNPDNLMPYMAEMWDSAEEYESYKKAWGERQMQTRQDVQGMISLKDTEDGKWQLLSLVVNRANNSGTSLPITNLKYDAAKNTWTSSYGELTATEFKANDDYIYHAQSGTDWKLEKKDSITQINQMLRLAKSTDGNGVFISFISVQRSLVSGQVLSQQAVTLLYPIPKPSVGGNTPGSR